MRKVTIKTKGEYVEGGWKRAVVFTGTKEIAGFVVGYAGEWKVTKTNGETKEVKTEKAVREYLGN